MRNIRRSSNEAAKKLEKMGAPEDVVKLLEKDIQVITDKNIALIDQMMEAKEKEVMTV